MEMLNFQCISVLLSVFKKLNFWRLHKLFFLLILFLLAPHTAIAAPTISITSPVNNYVIHYPSSTVPYVIAPVTDPGVTVSKIDIYDNGSLSWANVPQNGSIGVGPGTHVLTAKLTDSLGATATSSPVTVKVNMLPTVSLPSPSNPSAFAPGSTIYLQAVPYDSDGTISKVEFFEGTNLIGTATASPYTFSWTNVAAGSYNITAKATDNNGGATTSSITSTYVGPPPTVSITSPTNNAVFAAPGSFTVTANPATTGPGATVAAVYFTRDGISAGQRNSPPWSISLSGWAAGTYNFTATVLDSLGATATSAPVTVKVNTFPTVNISSPVTNTLFPSSSTINLTASAMDSDGTISKVEFFNGATLIGTATASPYTLAWANVADGIYTVTAKATDNNGSEKISTAITVKVGSAPAISITSPANNAVYNAPATFNITTNPTTPNAGATITKVEVFRNGALYGTYTASPWTASISNQGAGTYSFTAKVTDSIGASTTSAPVSVRVNAAPTVSISSPSNGAFFAAPATINFTATASDSDGTISKVEFFNGATLLGTATASPYTFSWANVVAGSYNITAKATDNDGVVTTSSVTTVIAGVPPTISITSPTNNAVFAAPGSFNLTANPATSNVGATIIKVNFYRDGVGLGFKNAAPWTMPISNYSAGTYNFTAMATDSYGATATAGVTVKVNTPPTVTISAPSTNSFFQTPATINLTASAADSDGTISKVEFFNGTTLIGTVNASPYTISWANVAAGSYNVTAKATDSDGLVTTSTVTTVKVGVKPTISITSPTNNAVLAAPASFTVTANPATTSPGATIGTVYFYRDGVSVGVRNAAPWTISISNYSAGTYSFTAMVVDSFGATATSEAVVVKVNTPPTVSITSPVTNAFFQAPATVNLTASAADSDGTISKVEFFNGATLIGTALTSPYTVAWTNVAAGTYSVTAKATDNNGTEKTSTAITVKSGAYPMVSLVANQNGTNTAPPFNFNLTASPATTNPGGSITKVQYYRDSILIGTTTAAPWTLAWNGISAGTYNLTAIATDNNNAATTSATITVMVGDFPPVIYSDQNIPNTPSTAKRTSAFEYDVVSGLLVKEIIEPDNPALCLVTVYAHDSYGNKVSATTRNCDGSAGTTPGINGEAAAPVAGSAAIIIPRTASTGFDTQGRFPVSSTNALNQTETKAFDGKFGVLTSLVGPNSLTTSWAYDTFGRKLTESRADGTSTQIAYAICDASCPSNAKYTITTTQAGSPSSKVYYDMGGRDVRADSQDKDGALIYSLKEYDKLGRVARTSRPVKASQTLLWTSITYDVLNRSLTTTAPDNSVSKASYNGKVTVNTNPLNQTKTERVNSQGQTIQVIDAQGKTISYQYDAFGNLTKTIDAANNATLITYDGSGRKTGMTDPDQGVWSYEYNALGQLIKQTDAKNQIVTFVYDKLGRMTQRNEPDLISTWAYDTCDATLNPAGKCVGKIVKETSDNGYVRNYLYDAYGRNTAELDNVDTSYGVAKSFDSYGRVANLVYPTGFSVNNIYSTNGYLVEVRNASTNALYWKVDTTDASGNVTQETFGNGVVTNRTFNDNTGQLTQINVGAGGALSSQSFVYDTIGNLTQRYDGATGLNESFGYDSLNRLTGTTAVSGSNTTSVTVAYNAIGNIVSKSDVGTYTYGTKPHAVTQIMMNDGVTQYASYTYDENGNNLTGYGRAIAWTSWNMPVSIERNGKTYGFVYNSAHERVKQTTPTATIYNISPRLDTGIHVEKRIKTSDGTIEYVHYLYAGKMPFGSVTTSSAAAIQRTRYFHTDHLGSIVAITDEAGAVIERRSYDAWGKRRNLNGTPFTSLLTTPDERHGFTGHEELDEVGIIHMNGRMYDPAIGRFLSADPTIQYPDDLQGYNRYSYINNNPLAAVDYSGYGFSLSKLRREIKRAFKNIAKEVLRNKWIRTAVSIYVGYQIGVNFMGTGAGIFGSGHAIANGAIGGFSSGLIQGRGDLRVAVVGAFSGASFGFVGDMQLSGVSQVFAHGVAGGASSVAGGGDFQSGFLSAGFAELAGGKLPDMDFVGKLAARMTIGGTASVIAGGTFANGAITSSFAYLYNHCQHTDCFGSSRPLAPLGVSVDANIQDALSAKFGLQDSKWYYDQVRNGGPWDYKQLGPEYENFGNFNFGATGAAFGYPEDTLLRMAGWAQVRANTSQPGWGVAPSMAGAYLGIGGRAPFGDDPNDQAWIKRGIDYYQRTRKKP